MYLIERIRIRPQLRLFDLLFADASSQEPWQTRKSRHASIRVRSAIITEQPFTTIIVNMQASYICRAFARCISSRFSSSSSSSSPCTCTQPHTHTGIQYGQVSTSCASMQFEIRVFQDHEILPSLWSSHSFHVINSFRIGYECHNRHSDMTCHALCNLQVFAMQHDGACLAPLKSNSVDAASI